MINDSRKIINDSRKLVADMPLYEYEQLVDIARSRSWSMSSLIRGLAMYIINNPEFADEIRPPVVKLGRPRKVINDPLEN